MNLVDSAWRVGFGAAAGGLAAGLLGVLGFGPIVGDPGTSTIFFFGLMIGAAAGLLRRERWPLVLVVVLLAIYGVIGTTPIMGNVADRWVRADPTTGNHDAIVVLSGYVEVDSALNLDGTERLLSAIELFRAGAAPRLITTRITTEGESIQRSSTIDQERLLGLAGITSGWAQVDGGSSTHDEAVSTAALLLPLGARRIIVVTSPFHTQRACAVFEAVGFTVSCYPARERQEVTRHPVNTEGRVNAFGAYVYERLGMIKYRWKGWLPAT